MEKQCGEQSEICRKHLLQNNEKWFMVLSKANVRHMVRSGIADAVESFDDKYKFITWFTVVMPRLSKALMTKTGSKYGPQ